jgi:PKD domain-containing protein
VPFRSRAGAVAGVVAAALLAATCTDSVGPWSGPGVPNFNVTGGVALDQQNGSLFQSGSTFAKGFNPTNPRRGSAVVATFFWYGSSNTITSVFDHLTNGTPVGNTYTLVEYVTAGGLSMATYVATNVQNFPDPNASQDEILVVRANFSQPVTNGGMMISAWRGVDSVTTRALGAHRSASGSGSGPTTAAPGAVALNAGALAYAVTMSAAVVATDPPAGFTLIGSGADNAMKTDARYLVQANAGPADPRWTWHFNSSSTWLASVVALNPSQAPPSGDLTATTSTSGSHPDPNGYTVTVDGSISQSAPTNGTIAFRDLLEGNHSVTLTGVSANCAVTGANPQTVTVPAGGTATASFGVSCAAPTGIELDKAGGGLFQSGTTLATGFNPANPRRGDAIVATFFWVGSSNVITGVTDHLSNGTPVGNTYQLVEYVTTGGLSMATYAATDVQNFPDPNTSSDQILVVRANLSQPVSDGGLIISAWRGVHSVASQAIGPHSSGSGSGSAPTVAAPGAVTLGTGALAYAVTAADKVVGSDPPPGFTLIGTGSDNAMRVDARYALLADAGTVDPRWTWFFDSPSSWLATVVGLNPVSTQAPGNLTVTTSTTGSALDPDGYTVSVDGGTPQDIGINGSASFNGLSAGDHSVTLSGVAANCTVSGTNPRTVTVPSGGTVTAAFSVSCATTTGSLTATTSTTGSNLDADGYTVAVDGGAPVAIGINGSVTFNNVPAGSRSVTLAGVAANCTVAGGNTQTVTVPNGGTVTAPFSVSCSATTGSLNVTTTTTGSSVDPDGYTVSVDGGAPQAIGINTTLTFNSLSAGNHSVQLAGVAANCTLSGSNPRTVSVPSGGTVTTTFSVSCVTPPGNLAVTTSTTGSSLDPDGYTVSVDGGTPVAIGINTSLTFTNLSAGSHSVTLAGVASNCVLSGTNPRTVSVPSGGTGSTTFSVTCTTPPGNLAVTTSTTGSSLDPDGYTVSVDGGTPQAIGINTTLTFNSLSAGNHSVQLAGVASNCTLSGANPRTVSVPSGGTATTTFSVSCVTPPGNLTVNTSTTGSSLDPNGYTVSVDGGTPVAIGINTSLTFNNLTPGSHSVQLAGVASNCTLSGANPRTVTVPSGGTVSTTFSVTCITPNTAPVANAGPDETALTGLLYTLSWSFTDATPNGPWSYTIEWGDGTTSTGTVSSQGTFNAGHTYITVLPRDFTIRVTVRDASGASGSDTKVVTVLLL